MCARAADFDSISDPIMKAKMVALKGINKVMTQGSLALNPMVINRYDPHPHPDPCPDGHSCHKTLVIYYLFYTFVFMHSSQHQ